MLLVNYARRNIYHVSLHIFIFTTTVLILSINHNWGLPDKTRLDLLGGITNISNRIDEIKFSSNLPNEDIVDYENVINKAAFRFLLSPWASDDNLIVRSMSSTLLSS